MLMHIPFQDITNEGQNLANTSMKVNIINEVS